MKRSGKSAHGIPFSLNAQTAREILFCSDCLKPRVIYSQLTFVETNVLSLLYTCGNSLKGLEMEVRTNENKEVPTV